MTDLEALLVPVVESAGLELVEVELARESGGRVLRVTVDREEGLDLDTIAATSERISRRLDLEGFDPGPGAYRLEVSSPGIERPLTKPEHFRRHVGSRVKVKVAHPENAVRTVTGELVSADAEGITVASDGGEVRARYDDIKSARTVFEWGAEQKKRSRG